MKKLKALRLPYWAQTRQMKIWIASACEATLLVETGRAWNDSRVLFGFEQYAKYCRLDQTSK